MGTAEGGEQTSWGSEGRCKHPRWVRGGARSKTYVSKYFHGFFITINSMILYIKHIIHIDDFPLNGRPPSTTYSHARRLPVRPTLAHIHTRTHSPTHPRTHGPTHPRTHAPAHTCTRAFKALVDKFRKPLTKSEGVVFQSLP